MSAEMQQAAKEDPIPTPVSALTKTFANMKVAEKHEADTVMQANADRSSASEASDGRKNEQNSRKAKEASASSRYTTAHYRR